MNLAIAVYATICRERGAMFSNPGGTPIITEAIDSMLFADALEWSFEELKSKNETYNITNDDVFIWHHLWPMICDFFSSEARTTKDKNFIRFNARNGKRMD
jgi:hypothetical protein